MSVTTVINETESQRETFDFGINDLGLDNSPRLSPDQAENAKKAAKLSAESNNFKSREIKTKEVAVSETKPTTAKKPKSKPVSKKTPNVKSKTGRTEQFNLRLRQTTIDEFHSVSADMQMIYAETMEHAVELISAVRDAGISYEEAKKQIITKKSKN